MSEAWQLPTHSAQGLRALIYVRHPQRSFDERSFKTLKEINSELPETERIMTIAYDNTPVSQRPIRSCSPLPQLNCLPS